MMTLSTYLLIALRVAVIMLLLAADSARAQSSQIGTVQRLHIRATDGLVYFYLEGVRSALPACASQSYWVVANETSQSGKQQLALLMMAQAAGKPVIVYGNGSCTRWSDGEDVREIAVFD